MLTEEIAKRTQIRLRLRTLLAGRRASGDRAGNDNRAGSPRQRHSRPRQRAPTDIA